MSQPVPEAEKKPSVFAVPGHIASVLIGGGCGVMHVVENGAVACEQCYANAISHIWPEAPQNVATSTVSVEVTRVDVTPPVVDAAPPSPEPEAAAKPRAKSQPTE